MGDFSNRFQFITRWFLIAGVLLGLCFSSGEGIQLLPFPAPLERESSGVPLKDGTVRSYSLSVHSCAANQGKTGAKAQKNLKFFEIEALSKLTLPTAKLRRGRIVQYNAEPHIFKRAGLSAPPSDRAPPVA